MVFSKAFLLLFTYFLIPTVRPVHREWNRLRYSTLYVVFVIPIFRGVAGTDTFRHRSNMELDLQSLFGLLCTAVLIG